MKIGQRIIWIESKTTRTKTCPCSFCEYHYDNKTETSYHNGIISKQWPHLCCVDLTLTDGREIIGAYPSMISLTHDIEEPFNEWIKNHHPFHFVPESRSWTDDTQDLEDENYRRFWSNHYEDIIKDQNNK